MSFIASLRISRTSTVSNPTSPRWKTCGSAYRSGAQSLRRSYAKLSSYCTSKSCADLPVRALSAGQKRRVALARIMLTRASLWILDEPITNLDKAGIALFEARIAEHMRAGGMILTAAHQLLLQGQPGVRTLELR